VFNTLEKNKVTGDAFWNKVQNDLQIPKNQIELLKQYGTTNREELITNMLADYSYVIRIDTAKSEFEKKIGVNEGYAFIHQGSEYNAFFNPSGDIEYEKDGDQISEKEYFKAKKEGEETTTAVPTEIYSNLTVPGGTNYTENEISTPAITPSIKGHAQFATDKGIGWFRSDDRRYTEEIEFEELENNEDETSGVVVKSYPEIGGPKTRRILEVQSDLFQKLRNEFRYKGLIHEILRPSDNDGNPVYLIDENEVTVKEYNKAFENFIDEGGDNQFLALLHKKDNWVTFFVKSIIQDSAKKGYEKVVFPTGSTAYKIESGGRTIEDFIKNKEDIIKSNEEYLDFVKNVSKIGDTYQYRNRSGKITTENIDDQTDLNEIVLNKEKFTKENIQLKKEIEDVKAGVSGLAATARFYQETVADVLKKRGYSPTLITDE